MDRGRLSTYYGGEEGSPPGVDFVIVDAAQSSTDPNIDGHEKRTDLLRVHSVSAASTSCLGETIARA